MRRRTGFAEVLDEKLGRQASDRPGTYRSAGPHIPTVNVFFLEFGAMATPVCHSRGQRHYTIDPVPVTREQRPPAPPRRTLSARENAALEQLIDLGATVDADFTGDDLRRAFRELALTFHPDRHPGSDPNETARLSRQFVRLHDAYRALVGVAAAA